MASENRALEDRIYEYDHAYRDLERELEEQQRINAHLQSKLSALQENKNRSLLEIPETEPSPKRSKPKSDADESFQLIPQNRDQNETIEPAPSIPRSPPAPPPIDLSPRSPSDGKAEALIPPTKELNQKLPPSVDSLKPEPVLPSNEGEMLLPPKKSGAPGESSTELKNIRRKSDAKELAEEVVMPPGIIRSAQQPKLLEPPSKSGSPGSPPSALPPLPKLDQGTILQGRIRLPDSLVIPASAEIAGNSQPLDTKIVEIGFHPTLCRGHNFDDQPGDDGIYLVLTPLNQTGQAINQSGRITIVAEEQTEEGNRRIAAWEISRAEVEELLEPIGVSQGFHLHLPWQSLVPNHASVQVFVKYESLDGRVLVNRREIPLRRTGSRQGSWTPR
jgi:hypothetical protein